MRDCHKAIFVFSLALKIQAGIDMITIHLSAIVSPTDEKTISASSQNFSSRCMMLKEIASVLKQIMLSFWKNKFIPLSPRSENSVI